VISLIGMTRNRKGMRLKGKALVFPLVGLIGTFI
jgi:hypothetical protein